MRITSSALAILGLTAAVLVFGYGLLVLFGAAVQGAAPFVVLALPIAVYEMILAGWPIVKGFNPSAIDSQATRTLTDVVPTPA